MNNNSPLRFKYIVIFAEGKGEEIKGFEEEEGQKALDYYAKKKKTGKLVFMTTVNKIALDGELVFS